MKITRDKVQRSIIMKLKNNLSFLYGDTKKSGIDKFSETIYLQVFFI